MSVIPKDRPSQCLIRPVLVTAGVLLLCASLASAERWSRRYIESLLDSAFASVEITSDGKKVRHLPHHNYAGEVDIYHLKSALSRIAQVKWVDPSNFARAKAHLEDHYREYRQKRAKAIIAYRETHGGFTETFELRKIPGMGPKIFKDIEDLVTTE